MYGIYSYIESLSCDYKRIWRLYLKIMRKHTYLDLGCPIIQRESRNKLYLKINKCKCTRKYLGIYNIHESYKQTYTLRFVCNIHIFIL